MVNTSCRSNKPITTLEACILIEETCAGIYRNFAEIYSDNEISRIWSKTAEEEDYHKELFVLAYKVHGSGYQNQTTENYLINQILANLRALKDDIRDNVSTVKEALIISAILERSIENYHIETAALMLDEDLAILIRRMTEYDKGHKELFKIAADSIGQFLQTGTQGD